MIETKMENITPDMAREYLKHNSRNRKIKPKTVEAYMRDILRGKFIATHQGIGFDANGELLDGQHRLLAISMAGKTVPMMVTRGLPREAVSVVDRGVSRSVKDVMQIETHYSTSNENINLAITNPKTIAALNQIVRCGYKNLKLTTEDIKQLYNEFADEIQKVYNTVITKAGSSARAPMISAAIAAVSCGVNIDAVSKFFYIFFRDDIAGCGNYNVNAVLNWRRQIDNARLNKATMNREKLYLGTQNAIYHFANNTQVQRVVAPADYRYDVEEKIKHALNVE